MKRPRPGRRLRAAGWLGDGLCKISVLSPPGKSYPPPPAVATFSDAMSATLDEYLDALKNSRKFGPQVVCQRTTAAQPATLGSSVPPLSPVLWHALQQGGVERLYSHQAEAIELIRAGHDVVVATSTASGKSLIYNLPVVDDLLGESPGHSLYLFPLKALAQDQYQGLCTLFARLPEVERKRHPRLAALFDGDTGSAQRRRIKDEPPRVLFTNPEMLHLSLLPYHQGWQDFFARLRYVVVDEVHSYRGIFGSHMAWVLRRLQRLAEHYGSSPVFVLLSATVGNPAELGSQLLGREVKVVTASGAPSAERHMLLLNPWDSAAHAASQLLEAAIKRGLRTIVYTQSRRMTELISMWTAPRLGPLAGRLSAYRAGFLPEERRDIERLLFSGELLGVVSTSALELGIDIGDLDLCLLVGYPGSIMATRQRGGRVGRAMRPSATVLIGQEDALDQHFMRMPEDFFARSPEAAVLNPGNPTVMAQHLQCAAAELPLWRGEALLEDEGRHWAVQRLEEEKLLLRTADGERWIASRTLPHRDVSLRGAGRQMVIIDGENGEIIGEIDSSRAIKECHQGAVYLHRATTWVVERFSLDDGEIVARRHSPSYFTRPTSDKRTEILATKSSKGAFASAVHFGRVRVTERVTGYQKRNNHTQKLVATLPLDMPEQTMESEGLWLVIPAEIVSLCEKEKYHFMGAIHALEHAMIALFPLLVLCDRNDIGGISCPVHAQTEQATIFIYDGYPGGVGLCAEAYARIEELLLQTRQTVAACPCENGCPSCVHSPRCGSGNRPIDKKACLYLLELLMARESVPAQSLSVVPPAPCMLVTTPPFVSPRGLAALPEHFVVFDVETQRSAEEAGGWHRADNMGLALAVVYDSRLGDFLTYLEDEAERLVEHLAGSELVVGFNNRRFDNLVLSAYTSIDLNRLPTLDLLEEVENALGYRISLNGLAEHTLGVKKTADGLQSLRWYKEGRIDLIRHYCRKDVEITRDLLFHALEHGYLLFANKKKVEVRLPLALDKRIEALLAMAARGS